LVTIYVKHNNVEQAIRALKRKVEKAGIIKDIRKRQYFSKPSEIKREIKKERAKVLYKAQKKNDEMLGFKWIKGVKVKRI
jgi:small subunit ribosomal protein S21